MEQLIAQFEETLEREDELLDVLLEKQEVMKTAVKEKNWENLTRAIDEINFSTDLFQKADQERDQIQKNLKTDELRPYFGKLGSMRSKLMRYKIENDALGKYVNITKNFINGVIDKALPQTRNKTYSRNGIVKPQPQSVVLNQLF